MGLFNFLTGGIRLTQSAAPMLASPYSGDHLAQAIVSDYFGQLPGELVDRNVARRVPEVKRALSAHQALVTRLRFEVYAAGTFVCNHVFYALMHHLAQATTKDGRPQAREARGGFIHVPALPELAARHPGMPSMALATQVRGLQVAIETALSVADDVREVGGALH